MEKEVVMIGLLGLPIFILAVLVNLTIPGLMLLKLATQLKNFWESLTLATVIGLVTTSLLSYLLFVINLPWLILPLLLIINFLYFKNLPTRLAGGPTSWMVSFKRSQLIIFLFVLIIGVVGQLLVIAPSGRYHNGDLIFYSAHGHDSAWHIALMEELNKGYPLQNPVLAGERLVNYHFFSDIIPAAFSYYLPLSPFDLYFRFFPLLYSLLFGGISYLIGRKLGGTFQTGIWVMIFSFFAGSFGFIVTWLRSGQIGGESLFWSSQPQSTIGNPPQIAATIILLTFIYLLGVYLGKKNHWLLVILTLLAGTIVVFKVYAAVVLLGALGIVSLWRLITKHTADLLAMLTGSGLLAAGLYLPNTSATFAFLIFEPWWFIRTMVVAPDRLNWLDLELKRQTYIAEGNWKRVIQVELTAFLIFWLGNLGMRFLGLVYLVRKIKNFALDTQRLFITLMIIISFIMPLLFLQKGVASNTAQFLQFHLLLLGIVSGLVVAKLIQLVKPWWVKTFISLLIIILTVPTQIGLLLEFYSKPPLAKISSQELQALDFLKKQSTESSVILTAPYNQYFNTNLATPLIWDWSDTAYVAAFSTRRTYLSDIEQVDIMGYDYSGRRAFQQQLFAETDPQTFINLLHQQPINYLYFPKQLQPAVDLEKTDLKEVFANDEIEIWQVN